MAEEFKKVDWMPIREDVEILPADNVENLKLGWSVYECCYGIMSGFGNGVGWSCNCGVSSWGHPTYDGAVAIAELHVLNHKEYNGGGKRSRFDTMTLDQLHAEGLI